MTSIEKTGELPGKLIAQRGLLKEHLIAVYVFGSVVTGRERNSSDIDLAFVFYEDFYKADPFTALQETEMLAVEMSREIQEIVDVVILNGASLSFAYHTLRKSRCVYEIDPSDRILFEVGLDNKYQDFMPFIKELRAARRSVLIGRD